MNWKAKLSSIALSGLFAATASAAWAAGELHFYNWGNYTPPEMIEAFEKEFDIEVTLDGYDSNDALLAKIKAGGSGYDVVVPSDFMVKIMIDEGLLLQSEPNTFENFKNVRPEFVDVYWDEGRHYTVPWLWGTTGIAVNRADIDVGAEPNDMWSWGLVMDPPAELQGMINMLPEMNDVMSAGLFYLGKPQCNDNLEDLKALNDLLQAAKPHWRTIEYGTIEKLTSHDVNASHNWNGATMRARLQVDTITYVYPKEGLPGWADNAAILADAPNPENAKLFLNYIMAPENAALMSNFARYANSIKGSEEFMDPEMATAPEVVAPEGATIPTFIPTCSQEVSQLYTRIWNDLLK